MSKSRFTSADIAYAGVFAALFIVLAFVQIPLGGGVPIVIQNACVLLMALVLGPVRAFQTMLLVFILGTIGLPVLPGGRAFTAAIVGPTGGFLVGYLLSTLVAGALSSRKLYGKAPALVSLIVGALAGLATQYICGSIGLVTVAGMDGTKLIATLTPLISVDLFKTAGVVAIAYTVAKVFPDLRKN